MAGGENLQNCVIAIGGLEIAYMRKLALYLTKKVGGQARIEIIEDLLQTAKCRPETVGIFSSDYKAFRVRSQAEANRGITSAKNSTLPISVRFGNSRLHTHCLNCG